MFSELLENAINLTSSLHDVGRGVFDTFIIPFQWILMQVFVVWPTTFLYYIIYLIDVFSGRNWSFSFNTIITGGENNLFLTIFAGFLGISMIIYIAVLAIMIFKVVSQNKDDERKQKIWEAVRKVVVALIVTNLIPLVFFALGGIINLIFAALLNSALGASVSNDTFLTNNNDQQNINLFLEIKKAFYNGNNPTVNHQNVADNNLKIINAFVIFNTISTGYSGEFIQTTGNHAGYLTKDVEIVARQVYLLVSDGKSIDVNALVGDQSKITNWNVFISMIFVIMMIYSMIMFLISVIARTLYVYILILISPVILGLSLLQEKAIAKYLNDVFSRMLATQIAILGYFLFFLIYIMMVYGLHIYYSQQIKANTPSTSLWWTIKLLQGLTLFAGVVVINNIPKIILQKIVSNAEISNNEYQEAKSTFNIVGKPLALVGSKVVGGAISLARKGYNNASSANVSGVSR